MQKIGAPSQCSFTPKHIYMPFGLQLHFVVILFGFSLSACLCVATFPFAVKCNAPGDFQLHTIVHTFVCKACAGYAKSYCKK